MFSKMKLKPTLAETYQEAKRVEAESESIEDYPDSFEYKTTVRRSSLLFNSREDQTHNFHEMMRVLQKMSNRIVDLEKERDIQKINKPHYPKKEDNNQWQVPPPNVASINMA